MYFCKGLRPQIDRSIVAWVYKRREKDRVNFRDVERPGVNSFRALRWRAKTMRVHIYTHERTILSNNGPTLVSNDYAFKRSYPNIVYCHSYRPVLFHPTTHCTFVLSRLFFFHVSLYVCTTNGWAWNFKKHNVFNVPITCKGLKWLWNSYPCTKDTWNRGLREEIWFTVRFVYSRVCN